MAILSASRTPENNWLVGSSSSINPQTLISRYRKRPRNLAVRYQDKSQEYDTPIIIQKARRNKLPIEFGCKLTPDRVDRMAVTGPPSEAYPREAQGLPLPIRTHLSLRPSQPKRATRQPTGTQGDSRSICVEAQRNNDGQCGSCQPHLVRDQFDWWSALGDGPVGTNDGIK